MRDKNLTNTRKKKKGTYSVNPEESTNTTTLGTRRHTSRHLEFCEPRPHTRLINTEDSEIFRLDIRRVVLIRNGQRTSFQVIGPVRMVLLNGRTRTDVVGVIGFPDVTTRCRSKKGGGTLVASDFGCGWLSSW